jgi:hypothetical protein
VEVLMLTTGYNAISHKNGQPVSDGEYLLLFFKSSNGKMDGVDDGK